MHTTKDELPAQTFGDYEGHMTDFGDLRVAFEKMPANFLADESGEAYSVAPGHFFQTIEDTELVEFSPRAEHDRTLAVIARNMAGAMA